MKVLINNNHLLVKKENIKKKKLIIINLNMFIYYHINTLFHYGNRTRTSIYKFII
jgi:DNA-directed RNA polymerase beta' subunit